MKLLQGMDPMVLTAPGMLDPEVLTAHKPEIFGTVEMRRAERAHDQQRLDRLTRDEVAVYRFFSPVGRLLYLGITHEPRRRFRDHAKTSTWWPGWAWRSVSWCPTRQHAVAIETAAIITERPTWNQLGIAPPSQHDDVDVAARWAQSLMSGGVQPTRAELDAQYGALSRLEEAGHNMAGPWICHRETVASAGWWTQVCHERAVRAFRGRTARLDVLRADRAQIEAGYTAWSYFSESHDNDAAPADAETVAEKATSTETPKTPKAAGSKKTRRGAA